MIELTSSKISTFVKGFQRQILVSGLVLGSSCALLLSGCSSGLTSGLQGPSGETVVSAIQGKTHGGQFPVSGATVQIYAALASGAGYGAASTPLGTAVTTDGGGNWSYGSFSCASGNDQLYVVSTGGNPGLAAGTNNPALILTAALGPCSNVNNISFVFIDEVTTVATEYALAGFSTDYLHVGTSPTNLVGLTNAFATVNNLVNIGTGQARTATPAYATGGVSCTATPTACTPNDTFRSIVPYDLINSLANVLASCVNTDGVTNPACSNLFAITGGSLAMTAGAVGDHGVVGIGASGTAGATNTADAALYIAHNPGLPSLTLFNDTNVANLLALVTSAAPFSPQLSITPNDLTMTVNFVAGGLGGVKSSSESGATQLAIDQKGNVWVPNTLRATVTELNNLGAPLPSTTLINVSTTAYKVPTGDVGGYPAGVGPSDVSTLAIDQTGNVWLAANSYCLAALNQSGQPLAGSPFSSSCSAIGSVFGVAVDAYNNIWIDSETGINCVSTAGTTCTGSFPITSGFDDLNSFLGADYTGHVWFFDGGNGHFGAYTTSGSEFFDSSAILDFAGGYQAFGALTGGSGIYSSAAGGLTVWVSMGPPNQDLQPVELTGGNLGINSIPTQIFYNTVQGPTGIAADGNSSYYVADAGATPVNVSVVTSGELQVSNGTTGYTGGSALMALDEPSGVAIDQSGNLWVVNADNANNNAVVVTSTFTGAGGTYYGNGINAANVTEFVGLAAPVNPVFSEAAQIGTTAMSQPGATNASVMTTPGAYATKP